MEAFYYLMDRRRSVETLEKRQDTKSKKFAALKDKIRANRLLPKNKLSEMDREVREMADAYEDAREEYYGVCKKIFVTRLIPGARWYSTLQRAVGFAKELKVTPEVYIKGLFYIADQWGNRAPKVQELADYKTKVTAQDRVNMYLQATRTGTTRIEKKVVGKLQPVAQVPQIVKSRQSAKQMQMFMKNFDMTEEEVLRTYAKGNEATMYFDRKWLLSLPLYLQLVEEGAV